MDKGNYKHPCAAIAKSTGKQCRESGTSEYLGTWYCGNHYPFDKRVTLGDTEEINPNPELKVLEELREALKIEFGKSSSELLNKEHTLFWEGRASAFSDCLQDINRRIRILPAQDSPEVKE